MVADLLRTNKEESARIRVEYVIRLERTLQAYEGRGPACVAEMALQAWPQNGARAAYICIPPLVFCTPKH